MTHTRSSAKDFRRIKKRTVSNKAHKSTMRTSLKKARTAVDSGTDDTSVKVKDAIRTLDKMVTKGIIRPNSAARKKSRLMKQYNNLQKGIRGAEQLKKTPESSKTESQSASGSENTI